MDLHLTAAQPTAEEKVAVDTELGPIPRRDMLLPVLHAIQARIGWISPGALNYASARLDIAPAEVHGVVWLA